MNSLRFFVDSSDENLLLSVKGTEVVTSNLSYTHWDGKGDPKNVQVPYCCYIWDSWGKRSIYDDYPKHGIWTKKIPLSWKNVHREFWGLKPLKALRVEKPLPEWYLDWNDLTRCGTPENVGAIPDTFNQWAIANGANRHHWFGRREDFKTWVFSVSTQTVINELAPMLKGSDFTIKLKCW